MKELNTQLDRLFTKELNNVKYYEFHKLMTDERFRKGAITRIQENYDLIPFTDLDYSLRLADKDLFQKFIEREITYDQFKSRIAYRNQKVDYKCLDDLKEKIDPSFYTNLEHFEQYFRMIYSKNPTH